MEFIYNIYKIIYNYFFNKPDLIEPAPPEEPAYDDESFNAMSIDTNDSFWGLNPRHIEQEIIIESTIWPYEGVNEGDTSAFSDSFINKSLND